MLRRLIAMCTLAGLVFFGAACGDDDDDDTPADDTTEETPEDGDEDGDEGGDEEASQRDRFLEGLLAQGRSEDNAACIMDAIEAQFPDYGEDELYAVEGAPDDVTAAVPGIAAQCDDEVPSE